MTETKPAPLPRSPALTLYDDDDEDEEKGAKEREDEAIGTKCGSMTKG